MKGKIVLYGFWGLASLVLAILAMGYRDSASSILAEVEPQRYAISFEKPVKIKEIYVIPGQRVKKGDKLLLVERPDLLLDVERRENKYQSLLAEQKIKDVERTNKLKLARIQHEQEMLQINTELSQMKLLLDQHSQMNRNLESLNLLPDSVKTMSTSYIRMKSGLLEKELVAEKERYEVEINEIHQVFKLQEQNRDLELGQLKQEIALLKKEESEQVQYANVDGTIGNIYSEDEELVPPFETLISVYEENPTVIKALVSEHMPVELSSGDDVLVESTNRTYQVKGKVLEIGSRIVEYPGRLNDVFERPKWGREIFIKIPEESDFLNGEKVFVILK